MHFRLNIMTNFKGFIRISIENSLIFLVQKIPNCNPKRNNSPDSVCSISDGGTGI